MNTRSTNWSASYCVSGRVEVGDVRGFVLPLVEKSRMEVETVMVHIVGIAGSLRLESLNAALLRAALEVMPDQCGLQIETITDIPLYNGDVEETDGLPDPVTRLKDAVADADGLLLVTPEYNNSVPGVFKNAIDWMSRPASDISRVFGGKPVAVIGASPGGFGTVLAQQSWLPILRTLSTRPWWGGRLQVSKAGAAFDEQRRLADEALRERLRTFVHGFCGFCSEPR